jgi:putative transposase
VKYHRRVLIDDVAETLAKDLTYQSFKDQGFILNAQEVMPDHVHLFVTAHPEFAPATVVQIAKGITA